MTGKAPESLLESKHLQDIVLCIVVRGLNNVICPKTACMHGYMCMHVPYSGRTQCQNFRVRVPDVQVRVSILIHVSVLCNYDDQADIHSLQSLMAPHSACH